MAAYHELTDEQLLALPTNRLYTIYKLWRTADLHVSSYEADDLSEHNLFVRNKCRFIKAELDKRGHIPREDKSKKATPTKHLSGVSYWEERGARKYDQSAKEVHGSIENYEDAIGLQVYKKSKKPFKSKNLYNTVKSVTVNPHTGRDAFDFEEDSSIVDAHLCHLRKVKS